MYHNKYLKYKSKYFNLKKGGASADVHSIEHLTVADSGTSGDSLSRYIFSKKVFCFDFDKTFIEEHTGGQLMPYKNYYTNLPLLKEILGFLRNLGSKMYIVSRGINHSINHNFIHHGLREFFVDIYGASDSREISRGDWHIIKTNVLNEIVGRENVNKSQIFFFDDININIMHALKNGFINSYNNVNLAGIDLLIFIKDEIAIKGSINDLSNGEDLILTSKFTKDNLFNLNLINHFGSIDGTNLFKYYIFKKDDKEYFLPKLQLVLLHPEVILKDASNNIIYWNVKGPFNNNFSIIPFQINDIINRLKIISLL